MIRFVDYVPIIFDFDIFISSYFSLHIVGILLKFINLRMYILYIVHFVKFFHEYHLFAFA